MPMLITEVVVTECHPIESGGEQTIGQLIDAKIAEMANDLDKMRPERARLGKIEFAFEDDADWMNYIHQVPDPRRGKSRPA